MSLTIDTTNTKQAKILSTSSSLTTTRDSITKTLHQKSSGEQRWDKYKRDLFPFFKDLYGPNIEEKTMEKNLIRKLTTFLSQQTNGEFYTGKALVEALKDKVGALKGEYITLESIRRLKARIDKTTKKNEVPKKIFTQKDLDEVEKEVEQDITHQQKTSTTISDIMLRKSIQDRFTIHSDHTTKIKVTKREILNEKSIPLTEVAKVGRFQIYELTTKHHLNQETDETGNCIGTGTDYGKQLESGKKRYLSIRSGETKSPLLPNTNIRYTIEYDVKTQNIIQRKGSTSKTSHNAYIQEVIEKVGESHKQELIDLLITLSQTFPINNVGTDLSRLIGEEECLRSDGKIKKETNTKEIIENYLQNKTIIIGEKPTFILDETYTQQQVTKLCTYPDLKLDLTKVKPENKTKLINIQAKVKDTSIDEDYVSIYPNLRKLTQPLTTKSNTVFYEEKKKQISSLETYRWNEQTRKQEAINFLKANNMDTEENRAMIEAVKFTDQGIIINKIGFSNEKLTPQNAQRGIPPQTNYATPSTNKKGLRKQIYNGMEEYYYDEDAYTKECGEQRKIPVMKEDIEQALQALPGTYSRNNWHTGLNILSILLGLSMSGWVNSDGQPFATNGYGYLGSASQVGSNRWYYRWNETEGGLNNYNRTSALPALTLFKNSG